MKRILTGILAAMLAAGAQSGNDAERLFKAATNTELVDGDLKIAIDQYRKVAQSGNRPLAARALIRMAECYQKLGDAEAMKIYERVLREFADQAGPVGEARARLGKGQPEDGAMTARKVWSGAESELQGHPSPDGRYLVFVDPKTKGNVAIRDLITGRERLLTRHAGEEQAHGAAFSPDGKRIAYFLWPKRELRIINTDGSTSRVLHTTTFAWQGPAAWSPDSNYIAAVILSPGPSPTGQVALISTADGSVRLLKSATPGPYYLGEFSPDGRFLTYYKRGTETRSGGVFVEAIDGSREHALVQGPSEFRAPVWTPNGRAVVFLSNRSGRFGLWAVKVDDGKPFGAPELVKGDVGVITPMKFTRDGSYFYGVRNSARDVYVADFDPKELRVVSQPRRLTDRCIGCDSGPAWSPDGARIALVRTPDANSLSSVAVIHSLADGKERVLPKEFSGRMAFHGLHWLGLDSLLVPENSPIVDRNEKFWRFDVKSGEAQVLMDGRSEIWSIVALSPDGKIMFYSRPASGRKPDGRKTHLVRRDLSTGAESLLHTAETHAIFHGLAVAPDGNRVVFMRDLGGNQRALYIIPVEGGAPREIYRGTSTGDLWHIKTSWTRDGRYVIAVQEDPANNTKMWKAFPADGGEPVVIDPKLRMNFVFHPVFSPDGRRIAFAAGSFSQDVWVVKNLVPDARAAK